MTQQEQANNSMHIVRRRIRRQDRAQRLCVLSLVIGLLSSAAFSAEQPEPTATVAEITEDRGDAPKQCTWACLEWSKMCNVDPRGVYKCQRTCANFGEICE
jgi:hypothetical protein